MSNNKFYAKTKELITKQGTIPQKLRYGTYGEVLGKDGKSEYRK